MVIKLKLNEALLGLWAQFLSRDALVPTRSKQLAFAHRLPACALFMQRTRVICGKLLPAPFAF